MRVVCLEGSHGCGKTEIIKELGRRGHNTLDEGFLDMPQFSLHPQSFVMESLWVSKWIERVLGIQKKHRAEGDDDVVYFADRSPFSVLLYAPNGAILRPVIAEQMEDLLSAGIEIITVLVSVVDDILWPRIQERLLREPGRSKYNEGDRAHMDRAVKFYEENASLWDYTVPNDTSLDAPIDFLETLAYD